MKYFIDWEFFEDGKTIEPISLGIVSEDKRELYLEFEYDKEIVSADQWMLENVIPYLDGNITSKEDARIKILEFIGSDKPEFWAYYADYDWVVLCQLFGRMIDLPKGWPKFCMDLQQYYIQIGEPDVKPANDEFEHHALADARWNKKLFERLWAHETDFL